MYLCLKGIFLNLQGKNKETAPKVLKFNKIHMRTHRYRDLSISKFAV